MKNSDNTCAQPKLVTRTDSDASAVEDVHVRGLPSYLLQRGVGIAVIDSDESCLPVIRKLARACPVVWRPEG